MDSDRVLVMDLGKIVEFDHPFNLLKNKDGYFYKMVDEMGKTTFDLFHSVASEVSYNLVNVLFIVLTADFVRYVLP